MHSYWNGVPCANENVLHTYLDLIQKMWEIIHLNPLRMYLQPNKPKQRNPMNIFDRICCYTLHWRHNGRDCVSNHQPHDCLLNRLFRHRSNKTSKLRVTCLCVGKSPGPMNSPHKWPVTRKMFPFDDVIHKVCTRFCCVLLCCGYMIRF